MGSHGKPVTTVSQTAMAQAGLQARMTTWRVRDGRGTDHTLWDDALGDLLPTLGL